VLIDEENRLKTRELIRALPVLSVVMALTACTPATVPATPPAATATVPATAILPTAAPEGQAFAFNGVQITIPAAVAEGAGGAIVPAAQGEGLAESALHPSYTEITLTGYPVQNGQSQAVIQVFPVAEYERMNQEARQRVQTLQAQLAQGPAARDEEIAVLPVRSAAQVFRAQVLRLESENSAGVRFVTQYAQGLTPVTNEGVFYTYQGLTPDGAHWVSATLPVNAGFLAADAGSSGNPPAGGIPVPDLATADGTEMKAYYEAVTERLNATPAGEFTPSLEALDAMMRSLRVTAP